MTSNIFWVVTGFIIFATVSSILIYHLLFREEKNYLHDENLYPKNKGRARYRITFTMTHRSCNEDGSNMKMWTTDEKHEELFANSVEEARSKFCFHKQRSIAGCSPPSDFSIVDVKKI